MVYHKFSYGLGVHWALGNFKENLDIKGGTYWILDLAAMDMEAIYTL